MIPYYETLHIILTHPQELPSPAIFLRVLCSRQDLRGAVKRVPRNWRDKQISRQMQFNDTGGETMRILGLDDGGSNEDPYEEVIKVAGY